MITQPLSGDFQSLMETPTTNPFREEVIVSGLLDGINAQSYPAQLAAVSRAIEMFQGRAKTGRGVRLAAANSILLAGKSQSGKMVAGLMIASHFQRLLGMTVGWIASGQRLIQLCDENDRRNFNVDFEPISVDSVQQKPVDMLIFDQHALYDLECVTRLHQLSHPQIVIGMADHDYISSVVRTCFDQTIGCSLENRDDESANSTESKNELVQQLLDTLVSLAVDQTKH